MTTPAAIDSSHICEATLQEIKDYNSEHKILPSETAVIDRLLARSLELTEAYAGQCQSKLLERRKRVS